MANRTEQFLERATAGLASDAELRLDVQAELRSHIEDKVEELGGPEHAEEAVACLGDVVELSEEVVEANRRRLGWRSAVRRLLRFGLVPIAVVCAILFTDVSGVRGLARVQRLLGNDPGPQGSGFWGTTRDPDRLRAKLDILRWLRFPWLPGAFCKSTIEEVFFPRSLVSGWLDRAPRLTEQQRLLLGADSESSTDARRALWQSDPTNRVYLANHVCDKVRRVEDLPGLEQAQEIDPGNARYAIARAMIRANAAAAFDYPPQGDKEKKPVVQIKDRAALDAAMAELLQAVDMPEYHRYCQELLREKLDALGPPDGMADAVRRTVISASVLLPDLSILRDATRWSIDYARLLQKEGRSTDALPFLSVPEKLNAKLLAESFCLIDLLVSRAIVMIALDGVPPILRQMGRENEAAVAEKRLAAILEPSRMYRERRDARREGLRQMTDRRAGPVGGALLSSLAGQKMTEEEMKPGRQLEYTVLTEGIVAALEGVLLAAMLAAVLVAVYWRVRLGRHAAPLLLLPSWRSMLGCLLFGIAAPFALFMLWTLLSPWSGQAYGPRFAGHRMAAELALLVEVVFLVPTWLGLRAFRRRCVELELAAPRPLPRFLLWAFAVAGLLPLIGGVLPVGRPDRVELGGAFVGAGVLALAACCLMAVGLALAAPRSWGRELGTVSRSLVPVFASAVLALSVVAQPILRAREHSLLYRDQLMWSPDGMGFIAAEERLVKGLRSDIMEAMAKNPAPWAANGGGGTPQ